MKTIKDYMFEVNSIKILEKSDQERIRIRDEKVKYIDIDGNEFYSLKDARDFYKVRINNEK